MNVLFLKPRDAVRIQARSITIPVDIVKQLISWVLHATGIIKPEFYNKDLFEWLWPTAKKN